MKNSLTSRRTDSATPGKVASDTPHPRSELVHLDAHPHVAAHLQRALLAPQPGGGVGIAQHEGVVGQHDGQQPLHGGDLTVGSDLLAMGHLGVDAAGEPAALLRAQIEELHRQVGLAPVAGGAVGRVAVDLAAHQAGEDLGAFCVFLGALDGDASAQLRQRRPRAGEQPPEGDHHSGQQPGAGGAALVQRSSRSGRGLRACQVSIAPESFSLLMA